MKYYLWYSCFEYFKKIVSIFLKIFVKFCFGDLFCFLHNDFSHCEFFEIICFLKLICIFVCKV